MFSIGGDFLAVLGGGDSNGVDNGGVLRRPWGVAVTEDLVFISDQLLHSVQVCVRIDYCRMYTFSSAHRFSQR